MAILLISTSGRHTPVDQPSGHLFVFDLEKNEVIRRCEMIEPPYREENPNPRGGLRGLKGISIQGNRVAIANASTIFIYDELWKPVACFYHPSCASIHDIMLDNDKIWISSARNDLLCSLDFDGKMLQSYDARTFSQILNNPKWKPKPFLTSDQIKSGAIDFRDPRTHDEIFCDTAHVNGLSTLPNGDLLLSCGLLKKQTHLRLLYFKNWLIRRKLWPVIEETNRFFRKRIFKIKNRHSGELVVQPAHGYSAIFLIQKNGDIKLSLDLDQATAPSHSIRVLRDGTAVYLKTTNGEVIHYWPENGEILSTSQVGENFLRGARELPDGTLVLGDNNKLIHFDLKNQKVISITEITDNQSEAIFDFYLLPDHFSLPPLSFIEHHKKYMPVSQT